MKKTYQKPIIKIREIDNTTSILAASPGVGGNTGITPEQGEPPASGDAKRGFFNVDNSSSDNIWDKWEN